MHTAAAGQSVRNSALARTASSTVERTYSIDLAGTPVDPVDVNVAPLASSFRLGLRQGLNSVHCDNSGSPNGLIRRGNGGREP